MSAYDALLKRFARHNVYIATSACPSGWGRGRTRPGSPLGAGCEQRTGAGCWRRAGRWRTGLSDLRANLHAHIRQTRPQSQRGGSRAGTSSELVGLRQEASVATPIVK